MFRSSSAYLEYLQNRELQDEQEPVHESEAEQEDYPSGESSNECGV